MKSPFLPCQSFTGECWNDGQSQWSRHLCLLKNYPGLDVWSWLKGFCEIFCLSLNAEMYSLWVFVKSNFRQKICPSLDVKGRFLSNYSPKVYLSSAAESSCLCIFQQKNLPRFECLVLFRGYLRLLPWCEIRKNVESVVLPMSFQSNQVYSILLFSKASELGFDNLCLCRANVLSENALISSIRLLTMLLNKNCPSLANCDDVGSEICFLRLAFEGLYLWNKESLGLFFGLWIWRKV